MKKETSCKVWMFLLAMSVAIGGHAAEINLSSATDFTRMELLLKDNENTRPDYFSLSVTLNPEATERMQDITRASIGQPLTLSINGWKVVTATVQSALGSKFRVSIPRALAKDLLPTLID